MRLTAILLTITFFHAVAGSSAQNVTVKCKESSLQEVFKQIEKQTNYTFFYKTAILATGKPVTIEMKNVPVETVLEKCFNDQPFTYAVSGRIITIKPKEEEKPVKGLSALKEMMMPPVNGRITDSTGLPLSGVTLTVRGKKNSTTTDQDGYFVLDVSVGDVIVITHVGYISKEIRISTANINQPLSIKLFPFVSSLDEVAVLSNGYQELPRESATGAVQVINTKALQQQAGTNILDRLNNITTGVYFETRPFDRNNSKRLPISIRGLSTINGPQDPLVVLNGFIYEGNIDNIDPNLVETVTVLKDAAATSIWGARASNGVIVITTKRGKPGGKAQINFSASTMVRSKPDLHDVYQVPAADFIEIEEMLFNNDYFERDLRRVPAVPLSDAVQIFLDRRNGIISAIDSASRIDALKSIDGRDQYEKYFMDKAVLQQYALSITGGTPANTYAVSIGYTDDAGTYKSDSRKLNIALSSSYRPTSRFSLDVNAFYTNGRAQTGTPMYSTFRVDRRYIPYLRFVDDEGNQIPFAYIYSRSYTDTLLPGRLLSWDHYPMEDYKHQYTKSRLEELHASIGVTYKLFPFLHANFSYQYQQQKLTDESISDEFSTFARTTVNQFTSIDPVTGLLNYAVPPGGIRKLNEGTVRSNTFRGQLNANHEWGLHHLNAIAGAEVREARTTAYSFTAYGYTEDPLRTTPVDYVNGFPLIDGGYSTIVGAPEFLSNINRFVSFYANFVYTWNKRYNFSASIRRDGANIFGQESNDKWKPLWSVGAGWNIHDENFYRLTWLPQLKLRMTYGYSGNVDLSRTALPIASNSFSYYTTYRAIVIGQLNDPRLRWEKTNTFNIGIDFNTAGGILEGSIDFFHKRGRDLYGRTAYDYTVWGGSSFITKNAAGLKGNGLELMLTSRVLQGAFKWNPSLLLSVVKTRTAEYYDAYSDWESNLLGSGSMIMPVIGKPLYGIVAFRWAGLDSEGNPQGYLDGQPSTDYLAMRQAGGVKGLPDNFIYKGSAVPEVFGSVINRFSYKSISIAFNISFKAAYWFQNPASTTQELFERGIGYADLATRWRKPGDEKITNMPALQYDIDYMRDDFYANAEIHVHRGDHLRLEYINLAYTFQNLLNKKISSLELYANAANLGILWKANKAGADPAYVNNLRPLTSFTAGIRAGF